jgi:hypothetical protein
VKLGHWFLASVAAIAAPDTQDTKLPPVHKTVGSWTVSDAGPATCIAYTELGNTIVAIGHNSSGNGLWSFNIASPTWSALDRRDGEIIDITASFETSRLVGVFTQRLTGKVLSQGDGPPGVAYSMQDASHVARWYTAAGITLEIEGSAVHVRLASENAHILQSLIRCSNGLM